MFSGFSFRHRGQKRGPRQNCQGRQQRRRKLLLEALEDRRLLAVRTWDGGSASDDNWTTAANWVGDVAPSSGDDLVFDNTGVADGPAPVNDYPDGTSFASIALSNTTSIAVSYTLSGNRVVVATSITDSATRSNTISLVLDGPATLTKSGASTLTLNGANSYTGTTNVNGGVLRLGNPTALGTTAAGTVVASGARLDLNGQTVGNEALTLNGTGPAGPVALNNSSATAASLSGNVTLNTDSIVDAANITLSGTVSGAGLTKKGAQVLTLSGPGSSVTSLYVIGGTLSVTGQLTSTGETVVGYTTSGILNWSGTGTLGGGTGWVGAGNSNGATGTINVTGGSLTISAGAAEGFYLGHNGSGNLNVSGGAVTVNSNGRPVYIGGIPGQPLTRATAGTLTVSGSGVVNVAGTNTDTLLLGADNALAGGTVNINSSGTLQTARSFGKGTGSATINFAGGTLQATGNNTDWIGTGVTANVTGSGAKLDTQGFTAEVLVPLVQSGVVAGGLTKLGSGTLVLGGASTYTGATQVSGGTLQLKQAGASLPATTAVTVAAGAALDLNDVSQSILSLSGPAGSAVTLGTATLTTTNTSETEFAGVISGSGGLVKRGGARFILSGPNTYTGSTHVQNGALQIRHTTALGTAAGATSVSAGATLEVYGNGLDVAEELNSLAGTLSNLAGANVWSGPILVAGGDFNIENSRTLNVIGRISGGSPLRMTLGGYLVLSNGTNNYTGGTIVSGGTLRVGVLNAIPDDTVTVDGRLDLNGISEGIGDLEGSGTVINEHPTDAATLTVGLNNQDGDFAGFIAKGTSLLGLTKTGTGTQTLSGSVGTDATIYTGLTFVENGTLALNKSDIPRPAVSRTVIVGDGTNPAVLKLLNSDQIPDSADVEVQANATFWLNGNQETIDALNGLGTVTNTSSTGATLWVGYNADPAALFSGLIEDGAGGGTLSLTKIGVGTQTLGGNSPNTFTGTTLVQNGTLVLSKPPGVSPVGGDITIGDGIGTDVLQLGASDQIPATTVLKFISGTVGNNGVFDLNGHDETLQRFISVGDRYHNITNTAAGTSTLTVDAAGGGDLLFSGTITDGGSGKVVALTKTGPRKLTLTGSGTNTYSGETDIREGTLALAANSINNIPESTLITVREGAFLDVMGLNSNTIALADGQTLQGDGTVTGQVNARLGSTVSPGIIPDPAGTDPGRLTTNGVTFQTASNFVAEIEGWTAGSEHDQLQVNGPVTILAGADLQTPGVFKPLTVGEFVLISNDGTDPVTLGAGDRGFDNLPEGGVYESNFRGSGFTAIISYRGGDGNDVVIRLVTHAIGDFVWRDDNADGIQNDGDTGINGVLVNLLDSSGGLIRTTTTNNNPAGGAPGYYQFADLLEGSYTVVIDAINFASGGALSGYTATPSNAPGSTPANDSNGSPATVILTTQSNQTIDFGYQRAASIGDYVWQDVNADGIQDAGEPAVPGMTVTLLGGGADGVIGTGGDDTTLGTTTNGSGSYQFTNLTPGTQYQVLFSLPSGYVSFTKANAGADDAKDSDAIPGTGRTQIVTLTPGQNDPTLDAGLLQAATLGDFVWRDANNNGIQDAGEPGIAGVTVTLTGTDAVGNPVNRTTVTDASGGYLFNGATLLPGTYTVTVTNPGGYQFSPANQGSNDAVDSDVTNPTTGATSPVTLGSGELNRMVDAGLVPLASLGDFVWDDLNANGIQDAGEPAVAGVTVTLIGGGADGVIGTGGDDTTLGTTTNGSGSYQFTNLTPGTQYQVLFSLPSGYLSFTKPNAGADDEKDSDAMPGTGRTQIVTLAPGQNNMTLDAGLLTAATLGNFVWRDVNNNGIQDAGEPGIAGVTVTLTGTDAVGNPVNRTMVTDAGGIYLFNGTTLLPGTYTVTVTNPGGYQFSPANQGADDAKDSDVTNPMAGATAPVSLGSGEVNETVDAGLVPLASLGDFVWEDLNADGIQNDGNTGINGVVVDLLNSTGGLIRTTTTINHPAGGSAGYYEFSNLAPGTYQVRVDASNFAAGGALAGLTASPTLQGGNTAMDSNPQPSGTTPAALGPGQIDPTVDFGYFRPQPAIRIVVLGPEKNPGYPQRVKVVNIDTQAVLSQFVAYEDNYVGGTRVAVADLNKDGDEEIITGPGRNRVPEVRVFDLDGNPVPGFPGFLGQDAAFTGGIQVNVADVNGDGKPDIITVPSYGAADVRVFLNRYPVNPAFQATADISFRAFATAAIGGAVVAAADMGRLANGSFENVQDGKAEIVVATGGGTMATVAVFEVSGASPTPVQTFSPFTALNPTFLGGVSLAVARIAADSIPDIIAGMGVNGTSRIEVWNWNTATASLGLLGAIPDAFTGPSNNAPVNVAAMDTDGNGFAEAIFAVQGPIGTTGEVHRFDITGTSPFQYQSAAPLTGFPGPWFIASGADVISQPPPPVPAIWTNPVNPLDVNNEGMVTPLDVLETINFINVRPGETTLPAQQFSPPRYFDTSVDRLITARDVLLVTNHLNRLDEGLGEGEMGEPLEEPLALAIACLAPIGAVVPSGASLTRDVQRDVVPAALDTAIVPAVTRVWPSAESKSLRVESASELQLDDFNTLDLESVLENIASEIAAGRLGRLDA